MKRSNRLVLLVGVFLAIVAFVLILITLSSGGDDNNGGPSTTQVQIKVVVATRDLPLGSKILADAVEIKELPDVTAQPGGSFTDVSFVIGQTVRKPVTAGQMVTSDILTGGGGTITDIECPVGLVCIAVQVDQVTGVGTLTKPGDHVDMLVGLTGDKFPVVTINPDDESITVVSGLNSTSVKLLLQGLQVVGTLLPPPPSQDNQQQEQSPGSQTALTGQQQIVIVAVQAQQAEVIKYAQLDGNISLVLRSTEEFRDPTTGEPLPPEAIVPVTTTGITLKGLVDDYGVLVPELVEAVLPEQPAP